MLLVHGAFCPAVAHWCAEPLDPPPARGAPRGEGQRCLRFRDDLLCEGRPALLHFCIDRLEYPNLEGVRPALRIGWRDAERACAAEDKRLCDDGEWSFACEGARTSPYPWGLSREPGRCNLDRRVPTPNLAALATPAQISVEVERLDLRAPSGSFAGCASAFGVLDTSGNVAEWVRQREEGPVLKGGYWGASPATCRPFERPEAAQQPLVRAGFRCCRDAADGQRARRNLPAGARLPNRRRITGP